MNIFVLSLIPYVAAQYHCDKHVVKMILEYAMMLCAAHRLLDGTCVVHPTPKGRNVKQWVLDDPERDTVLYKATHVNHPCTKWARASTKNYEWLYDLFCCLCDRYTMLYGKVHATDARLRVVLRTVPGNLPEGKRTPFAQAMPDQFKVAGDAVTAYRIFYLYDKVRFATWKDRGVPWWFHGTV